jgi:hypothetical protein
MSSLTSTAEKSLKKRYARIVIKKKDERPVKRDPEKKFLRIPKQKILIK